MPVIRRALLRRWWYRFFDDRPLAYPGRLLLLIAPRSYVERIQARVFAARARGLVARSVEAALESRFKRSLPAQQQVLNRRALWGGPAGRAWPCFSS